MQAPKIACHHQKLWQAFHHPLVFFPPHFKLTQLKQIFGDFLVLIAAGMGFSIFEHHLLTIKLSNRNA